MDRARLIDVTTGRRPAELCITNCRIVNVFTREITDGSVAIDQGLIAGVGEYDAMEVRDAGGRHLLPGLIDSHVHIESSLLTPEQFARLVLPHGTTTVIADPHEIANVCGLEGIRYMIRASREAPLDVFFMLPSCVPATSFENAGATLDAAALATMMGEDQVLGLGEMMDYPSVLAADPGALAKIESAAGRPVDGHAPMVLGRDLQAYRAAGIGTDHECSTLEEMRERLQLGMRVLIREGSVARNLRALIHGVDDATVGLCSFCTDDKQPADLLAEGSIDHNLRLAVAESVDAIMAVEMATIHAARGYGLADRGAVAPGYLADLVLVDDLESFTVREVYKRGELVARDGSALFAVGRPDRSAVSDTVHGPVLAPDSLALPLRSDRARVIGVQPGSLITKNLIRSVSRDDAGLFTTGDAGICKLAVIERHGKTGTIGLGLVEGIGLRGGALATTIAHDSHNLIVVGDNDGDMLTAARHLMDLGGGLAIVRDGVIAGDLALPVAGLMTDEPGELVSETLAALNKIAWEDLGVARDIDPFMALSFLALPVIPDLKLTDLGLFDVNSFSFTSIDP